MTQYSSPAGLGCGVLFWHAYYCLEVMHLGKRQSFHWVHKCKSGPHMSWKQTVDGSWGTESECSPLKGVVLQCLWPADVTPIWSILKKISISTATTHDFPVSFSTNRAVSASLKPLAVVFSQSQTSGSAQQHCGCWPAGWYHSMNWSLSNILSLPALQSPFPLFPNITIASPKKKKKHFHDTNQGPNNNMKTKVSNIYMWYLYVAHHSNQNLHTEREKSQRSLESRRDARVVTI